MEGMAIVLAVWGLGYWKEGEEGEGGRGGRGERVDRERKTHFSEGERALYYYYRSPGLAHYTIPIIPLFHADVCEKKNV